MPAHVLTKSNGFHGTNHKTPQQTKQEAIRKPGAKRFSFTRAELGDVENQNVTETATNEQNKMNNNLLSMGHDHTYSDDLDDLVMYNANVGYLDHRAPGHAGYAPNHDSSFELIQRQADVENNINYLEAEQATGLSDKGRGYGSSAKSRGPRGRSLEEEASRPEVMALINKYQPYSYTSHQLPREMSTSLDQGMEVSRTGPGGISSEHNGAQMVPHELSSHGTNDFDSSQPSFPDETHGSIDKKGFRSRQCIDSKSKPVTSSVRAPRSDSPIKGRARSVDSQRRRIQFVDHQRSLSRSDSDSDVVPERRPRQAKTNITSTDESEHMTTANLRPKSAMKSAVQTVKIQSEDFVDSLPPIPKRRSPNHNSKSVKQSRPLSWQDQAKWDLPLRSLDDSSFSLSHRAASDSSDRSSRLDPQTYQCYAAGILHSAKKSDKFVKLQSHYNTLERIAAIEEQTVASNARSGKQRFNLLDIRSKSLGSLAPQSRADDILTSKYKPERIWELKELYADLEEAQEDEEFLFDAGNLCSVQWNPWQDLGLQTRESTTQDLQRMFEAGRNQNTRAALNKIYRGIAIDFKRELSFTKVCEKYKHLDEESRRQKITEEWANMHHRSRRNSETSSILSYSSNVTGSYIDIMEKAAQKAKERALYGYHIQENNNRYERRIEKLKKKTKSCPDIHQMSIRALSAPESSSHIGTKAYTQHEVSPSLTTGYQEESRRRNSPKHLSSTQRAVNIPEHKSDGKNGRQTAMGDLLRQELGELPPSDQFSSPRGTKSEIQPKVIMEKKSPPWQSDQPSPSTRSKVPADPDSQIASQCSPDIPNLNSRRKHRDVEKFDAQRSTTQQKTRTNVSTNPPWKSEIRTVIGTKPEQLDQTDSSEDFHGGLESMGRNLKVLNNRLENFRKRDGWRKSSKPQPGTVSKALTKFQSLEEEIVPVHSVPLLRRDGQHGESTDQKRRYTDFGDYSSERLIDDRLSEKADSLLSFEQRFGSRLKHSRSEPELNKDALHNPDAYQEAKGKFERMSSESETGSYPKSGLPTKSLKTALGRYEARIRSKSESRDKERPKSDYGTEYMYIDYPEDRPPTTHVDKSLSRSSPDVTKSFINTSSTKNVLPRGTERPSRCPERKLSPRRQTQSQAAFYGEAPAENNESPGYVRDPSSLYDPSSAVERQPSQGTQRYVQGDDTSLTDPRYHQPEPAHIYKGETDKLRQMPDVQRGINSSYYPDRQPKMQSDLRGGTDHMYETDLDTSRSQPLKAADLSQEDHGYNTSYSAGSPRRDEPQQHTWDNVRDNSLRETGAQALEQAPYQQQHSREGLNNGAIRTHSYTQKHNDPEMPHQQDVLQPLPEIINDTLIHPHHRSFSTSALTTDETISDPSYGDLSRWSHINVTQDLDRHQSQSDIGKLSNLSRYGSTTMSSQETFIIRDSDYEMSPTTEYPQSASSSITERDIHKMTASRELSYEQEPGAGYSEDQAGYYREEYPEGNSQNVGAVPRTISGDFKDLRNEYGQDAGLAEREWEKHQPQTPTTPIGPVTKRDVRQISQQSTAEASNRYSWKREYDVPPNLDIDDVKNGKKKQSATKKLNRSWDVIRNYTPEIGPKEFYHDLETIGNEWQREKAKQQLGNKLHYPGYQIVEPNSMYPPEYKPPPKYVHPWNELPADEQQTVEKRPVMAVSHESLDRFHPPAHSTPFTSNNDLLYADTPYAQGHIQQSQSYPANLANVNVHNTTVARPQSLSSHHATHLPINKSQDMHDEKDQRHGSNLPTNQSERSQSASERNEAARHRHVMAGGRSPTGSWDRKRREEEIIRRKQEMHRITAEEKRKRMEVEMRANEARRHNDFLTPAQKSPIALNRYEDPPDAPALQRPKKKMTQYKGKAKALYNFKSQNTKEMSFRKNDVILLLRQIDKNWYEGEHHGRIGIFPVNYVEVLTSLDEAREAAILREGQGKARHSFTAHSNMELSFRKGETVSLVRRIDDNWYEGRCGRRHGIFPISYVDILTEPDTPYSSYAPTPMTGSPSQLSPVSTISNGPAPTIPSAPISPRSSVDNFDFGQPYNYGPNMSAASTLQRAAGQRAYQSDYGSDMLRPSSALGGHSDSYDSMQRDRYNLMNRPSSAVPFSDYYGKHSTRDSGFQSSDESRYPRQQSRQQDPVSRSMSNSYEARIRQNSGSGSRPLDDISLLTEETKYPKYQALYTYKPQNADELALQEGDVVYVMEICDDDWYVGTSERTKEFGTFPGNYVKIL